MHASLRSVLAAESAVEPRIADHGAIGAGRSVALVTPRGAITWWCPGRFDAPSVFASILDASRGGEFSISPADARATSAMAYVPGTNVLETVHELAGIGRVRVTDLMPFAADTGDEELLLRRIEGLDGALDLDVRFAPRFHYGAIVPRITRTPDGWLARGAGRTLLVSGLPFVEGRLVVRAGERIDIVVRHAPYDAPAPFASPTAPLDVGALEARTIARWRAWSAQTRAPDGADGERVRRAALALKLLQDERTGAIVAAPTTSLPEELGGVRNWDYRYAWVRDGALCAEALAAAGHEDEAAAFARWLERTLAGGRLRVLYSVAGGRDLPERVLPQLRGHRASGPVRIGNEAATQRQLDVVGELFHFLAGQRPSFDADLARIADEVASSWREPDSGIWEVRCEPKHFVLSKAMASLALDKAASMMPEHASAARWRAEADAARALVLAEGYDADAGTFVQAVGERHVDASNLLLALTGFLDARDPRMMSTTARIRERLMANGLVYRYLGADDGVTGDEATFAYCTFWLVEVLARQGAVTEARAIFDALTARATSLGLYAEEIDAATGEHLGNFPQGFPHAGLIQAALALDEAERRPTTQFSA